MEIGAILFSLAMVVLVVAYVLRPLAGSAPGGDSRPERRLSALQAERDRVLDSIQDIDMDQAMGKVPEEDHRRRRQALALEGAEILRKIDKAQLRDEVTEPQPLGKSHATREVELEAAIRKLRGKGFEVASEVGLDLSDPASGVCPECGEAIFHGDRFCANCGATLEEQVA
ncbi:MAG: hypothetical protein BMS9Abin28_0147 [Anaerolineae bacterium]|nr:MAG: hypothetical protein BMS9Abin28_0147 [Anaerolineae bacterium]